jgi:nucleoid-associated protein YgaU
VPEAAQEVVQALVAELPPAPEPSASEPSAQVAVAEPTAQVAPAAAPVGAPVAEPAQSAMGSEQPLAVLMPRSGEGRIKVLQQSESASGGLGEGTLVLETVDYDAQGRTEVGGRAEIGSRLIVYLDDKPAAHTRAGATGIWRATLIKSIAPGLHRLRVDQLGTDGQVMARVETPFSRAEVLVALPEESAVIVQPGNSLWRISRRIYGEGVRYSVIYQANQDQIRDPDLIYPGQIFILPSTD